jgi:hypothetical protein
MTMRFLAAATAALFMLACGGSDAPATDDTTNSAAPATTATGTGESCLVGVWTMEEDGVTKSFTFNADHTGEEIESPPEVRHFTWSLTDAETVHIVYPEDGDTMRSEWDLDVDCGAGEVRFYGARYVRRS